MAHGPLTLHSRFQGLHEAARTLRAQVKHSPDSITLLLRLDTACLSAVADQGMRFARVFADSHETQDEHTGQYAEAVNTAPM